MDKMTKEQRHRCMSAIRGKNTKPEMTVRKFLFSRGFRYRLNHPRLPGHPDLVLRKYKTVIFVNGCFWHGHEDCRSYVMPKSNTEYWRAKIERNRARDEKEKRELAAMGWYCITVWECQLRPKVRQYTLEALEYTLVHIFLEDQKTVSQGSSGEASAEDQKTVRKTEAGTAEGKKTGFKGTNSHNESQRTDAESRNIVLGYGSVPETTAIAAEPQEGYGDAAAPVRKSR